MKVDIDRPSTWRKFFSNDFCRDCWGGCCTMPVEVKLEDLVRLKLTDNDEIENKGLKKVIKRLIKEKIVVTYREATKLFTFSQKANRDCIFLDSKTRKCTVYVDRPEVCREFPKIGPRPGFCPKTIAGKNF